MIATNYPYSTNRTIEIFVTYCERMCDDVRRIRYTRKMSTDLHELVEHYNRSHIRAQTINEVLYHIDYDMWERARRLRNAIDEVAYDL